MIYKLLHMLFGWDYILWKNKSDSGIARVRVSPEGKVYYWRYKMTKVADVIREPNQVLWLTCCSSYYFEGAKSCTQRLE